MFIRIACATALVALTPSCTGPHTSQTQQSLPTLPSTPEFDWEAFGYRTLQLPGLKKNREAQIPLVAQAVSRQLAVLGVRPNSDENGRKFASDKFGVSHSSIGTCGHVSRALRRALVGAGVNGSLLEIVTCRKPLRLNGLPDLSDFYNIDHAGLIYFGKDGPVVFDLWFDGITQGTYGRFEYSSWCGASFGYWLQETRKRGYAHYTFNAQSLREDLEPPTDRVVETWRARRSAIVRRP